ncbi:hypothetical protein TorRG33x02_262320 [Trema orientale]|uniref:RNase H type-1 domain-containing protein n=1 Tax=Trema orientale TaxID=63057 RepID=A0A2P5D4Z5_TREOI|nr:hypothetical protein TorRG33x02_262320 [Trema orientale]
MSVINEVFLAKWGWKVLTKEPSLWLDVIQVKYLRGRDFLLIEPSRGDSWIWRAILRSRDRLKIRACLQPYREAVIEVWQDPWVPTLPDFRPRPRLKVYTDNSPSPTQNPKLRLTLNCGMPSGRQRYTRAISFCGGESLIIYCQHGRNFKRCSSWQILRAPYAKGNPRLLSTCFGNVITGCVLTIQFPSADEFMLFASLCLEAIWRECNSIIHGNEGQGIDSLIRSLLVNLASYTITPSNERATSSVLLSCWLPPPSQWIKINVDVAIRDVFAVGAAVARDDRSTFLALRTSQLLNPDPLLSEANAMLLGFKLARDHRFKNIMRRLRPEFSSIVVSFIPRSSNFCAHNLAAWASVFNVTGNVRITDVPPGICQDSTQWSYCLRFCL